ncbi:YopX family protein [Clostridium sp.]|uniref:YopX family protein n=1 Tax=Clostridium sp. TaxID=1506 RepID=UPI002FDE1897
MKREIKFRGFSILCKKWMYGYIWIVPGVNLHYIRTGKIDVKDSSIEKYEVYSESIGQFTGLKDKNGKEVYEGDIVKEQRKRFKDKYFAVKWNNDIGSYIFEPLDKSLTSYPCFNIGTVKGLEVIGNIYENPELLEE